ncbi:MAG: histidine triad nucleotide-binding protein [Candidatus Sericytochromatia bacterium]|nr:histidine triad nucleotide-binding protein [Candidatus Sericytochromatia bacterium]
MPDCLFCRIIAGEIPATIIASNAHCVAFADINPQAPVHALVIPKKHVSGFIDLGPEDDILIAQMAHLVNDVAGKLGIAPSGFRVVCNQGVNGGQTVGHLHWHVLGGRSMGWPPG